MFIAPDLFAAAWLRENPGQYGSAYALTPGAALNRAVADRIRPEDFAWLSRVEPVYQSFKDRP